MKNGESEDKKYKPHPYLEEMVEKNLLGKKTGKGFLTMNDKKLLDQILKIMEEHIRPNLLEHNGNLEIMEFKEGIVYVKLMGQCSGCPSAKYTMEDLVKEELTARIPEVKDVVLQEEVNEELLDFARQFLQKKK